jgi:hypothetical protein
MCQLSMFAIRSICLNGDKTKWKGGHSSSSSKQRTVNPDSSSDRLEQFISFAADLLVLTRFEATNYDHPSIILLALLGSFSILSLSILDGSGSSFSGYFFNLCQRVTLLGKRIESVHKVTSQINLVLNVFAVFA